MCIDCLLLDYMVSSKLEIQYQVDEIKWIL